ncbi:hypothetical protein [Haematomicrobium sanguinis]|uniref:hypothetical protein n=1 Tax=Haematomicrobium sanguinis TaxID=479106 RepID=UPI00068E71E1|nr:hypothetical protein [Haematomicrobium sanguinis]
MRIAPGLSASLDDLSKDEARRMLEDELSKAQYQPTIADWIGERIGDFFRWLGDVIDNVRQVDPAIGTLLFAAVIIAVVLFIVLFVRPRIAARSAAKEKVMFDGDARLSASSHRKRAEQAARAGQFNEAVRERVRAIARSAEERALVDATATLTVSEFTRAVGRAVDIDGAMLAWLASSFNAFAYADVEATGNDYERVVDIDRLIEAAPRLRGPGAAGRADELVLPR